ncbi:hypothetical protein BC830DRAFT_1218613 [Chytriomyces sp. MP71]|nr:hypothetical protein BC830DRAFT_1218613 [Chytriomyces sp. MP71]
MFFLIKSVLAITAALGVTAVRPAEHTTREDGHFGLNEQGGPAPFMLHNETSRSMIQPMKLYIVWYGAGWDSKSKSIVTDFLDGLPKSDFWGIEKKYYQGPASKPVGYVTGDVKIGGQHDDNYSLGKFLNSNPNSPDNDVATVIQNAVNSGALPSDVNGFYLVLGDDQTMEGSFCTSYCGYHTSTDSDRYYGSSIVGQDLIYTWVGNPMACGFNGVYNCGGQFFNSPNGNPGVDSMLSPIAHELGEGGSNPDTIFNGWNNADGYENGDNCAYIFGSQRKYDSKGGYFYNQEWNGRRYQIQQMWDPATQLCGPYYPKLVPAECAKLHDIFPSLNLGNDCCNSGYADCADGHVVAIDVRSNNLTGDIGTVVDKIYKAFPQIVELRMGNIAGTLTNNFTGSLPATLCKMQKLEWLSLARLGLTGSIPQCFSHLQKLQVLDLPFNKLSGSIPDIFYFHKYIKKVTLQNNALSGVIPRSLAASTTLTYFFLSNNQNLTGSVPTGFTAFKGLSAGPINVSGPIPYCDFTGTALCTSTGYKGPTCGLTASCPVPTGACTEMDATQCVQGKTYLCFPWTGSALAWELLWDGCF